MVGNVKKLVIAPMQTDDGPTVDINDTDSGPIRGRTRRVLRRTPYSRHTSTAMATATTTSPSFMNNTSEGGHDAQDFSIFGKVKSIVGWLLPDWLSPTQEHGEQRDSGAGIRNVSFAETIQSIVGANDEAMDERDGEEDLLPIPQISDKVAENDSEIILKRLEEETEVALRRKTFTELVKFFRSKKEPLQLEEYNRLARLIQRNGPPDNGLLVPSSIGLYNYQTSSGYRTPLINGNGKPMATFATPAPMPLTNTTADGAGSGELERAIPIMAPASSVVDFVKPKRKTTARVFSARFDDADDIPLLTPSTPAPQPSTLIMATPASENRRKLVEEARQRVAEEIRKSQVTATESKSEVSHITISTREAASLENKSKSAQFSFGSVSAAPITIPISKGDPPSEKTPAPVELPKLVFDFGDSDTKAGNKSGKDEEKKTAPPASSISISLGSKKDDEKPLISLDASTSPKKSSNGFGGFSFSQPPAKVTFTASDENKPTSSQGFSFGSGTSGVSALKSDNEAQQKSSVEEDKNPIAFGFGAKNEDTSEIGEGKPSLSFSFGSTTTQQKTEETKQGFIFGNADKKTEDPIKPSLSFGFGSAAGTATAASTAEKRLDESHKPALSFSFGSSAMGESKTEDSKTPAFSFGSSETPKAFSFAPTEKKTSESQPAASFGFAKPPEEPAKPTSSFALSLGSTETKPAIPTLGTGFTFGAAPTANAEAKPTADKPDFKPMSSTFGQGIGGESQPFSFGKAGESKPFSFGSSTAPEAKRPNPSFGVTEGSPIVDLSGGDGMNDAQPPVAAPAPAPAPNPSQSFKFGSAASGFGSGFGASSNTFGVGVNTSSSTNPFATTTSSSFTANPPSTNAFGAPANPLNTPSASTNPFSGAGGNPFHGTSTTPMAFNAPSALPQGFTFGAPPLPPPTTTTTNTNNPTNAPSGTQPSSAFNVGRKISQPRSLLKPGRR